MWNYQEILTELIPSIIIEFGTWAGGSALFFATVMACLSDKWRVLSVDIDQRQVHERARRDPRIEFLEADSAGEEAARRIRAVRTEFPGKAFWVIDSNHQKDHVIRELLQIRTLTRPGDYVIVEDGNINGHPVLPGWGPGPYEALEEYFERYPDDYRRDVEREGKFGFTFAPSGFLIRS